MPVSGVRLARTSDVDGIADVNVRSWRRRFTDTLPADVLSALDPSDFAMIWASGILNPPTTNHRLLVAVVDADVVGYAAIGPGQDPDTDGHTAELLALEVDPERTRQGHGSRLMAAAVDHARGDGMLSATAWCPLGDDARRSFLQSAGWGPDTAFRDVVVGQGIDGAEVLVREVRLVTALD